MYPLDSSSLRSGVAILPTAEASSGVGSAGFDVSEILSILRRRRVWIAAFTAVALLIGGVAVLAMERRYAAMAQLVIDPRGLQVVENEVTPRGQTSDVNTAIVETQMQVLASDSVLRRVVERERLDQDPEFNGAPDGLFGRIKAAVRGLIARTGPEQDRAVLARTLLRERIRVQRAPGSYVVDLYVATRDPSKSAALAQAISQAFIEAQSDARRDAARGVSDALAGRLQELRDRVKNAENEVELFKSQNRIVGANGRLVNEQQLSELSNQLVAARARTGEFKARYEQVAQLQRSGAVPEATTEAVQSAAVAQLRARYAEVKRVEDDLVAKLGPRHPDLGSVRAQSQGLRQQIAEEVRRIAAAARNDYERARASEEALSRSLGSLATEANAVNSLLIRLRELEREAQASRAVYENFLNRTRETREQQEIDSANTRVISPAVPPLKPTGIPPLLLLAVAGALGMTLGAITAVARHVLDGTVHTPRQLTAATGLPVLAVLPQAGPPRSADRGAARFVDRTPDAPAAHAIYRLHALLSEGLPAAPQVVLVTSPDDRLGVSTVALNLALAASLRGEKVLLVDADPTAVLTRTLGVDGGPSLADVLLERLPLAEAIRPAADARIDVLAAGLRGSVPPSRLAKAVVKRTLVEPAAGFDLVVVDAGLAEGGLNGRGLIEAATKAVLVVRAEATPIERIEDVRTGFGALAAKVVGAVLVTRAPIRGGARAMRSAASERAVEPSPGRAADWKTA